MDTAIATIDCAITGAGGLAVDMGPAAGSGTLILGGNNRFTRGTDVQDGTLALENDADSGAGALLGTGAATIDNNPAIEPEGCPLTLNSLGDDTPGAAGAVKDTGSGLRASPVGVTPLSVNNLVDAPASAPRGYAGAGTQEPISESSLAVRGCQAIWRITPSSITATARSRT